MKKLRAKIRQAYYFLCYQYAHFVTLVWGSYRLIKYLIINFKCHLLRFSFFYHSWGRHDSPKPIRCDRCGWAGMVRQLIHTYEYDGSDDVEQVDECPKCGEYL